MTIQNEIMQSLIDQEETEHPIRAVLIDKGAVFGVEAITAVVPFMLETIKSYLTEKEIIIS